MTDKTTLYKAAIGEKSQSYYLEKFSLFDERGNGFNLSWNWAAFFGIFAWALYRKLYGMLFTSFVLLIIIAIANAMPIAKEYVLLMNLLLSLWFPVFGNSIYHRKVKAKIKKAENANSDEAYVIQRLKRGSGVYVWAIYGYLAIWGAMGLSILWAIYLSKANTQNLGLPPISATQIPEAIGNKRKTELPAKQPIDNNWGKTCSREQPVTDDVDSLRIVNNQISAYTKALILNPEDAMTWKNLGIAYNRTKQYQGAITAYKQALEINPEYVKAWYNLGITYYYICDAAKVLEVYKKLKILDTSRAEKYEESYVQERGSLLRLVFGDDYLEYTNPYEFARNNNYSKQPEEIRNELRAQARKDGEEMLLELGTQTPKDARLKRASLEKALSEALPILKIP
jgi:tetratricopeptide (TPR) repeat protein